MEHLTNCHGEWNALYLTQYEEEDYGELSKEQMEESMNSLRTAFVKFDSLLKVLNKGEDNESQSNEA